MSCFLLLITPSSDIRQLLHEVTGTRLHAEGLVEASLPANIKVIIPICKHLCFFQDLIKETNPTAAVYSVLPLHFPAGASLDRPLGQKVRKTTLTWWRYWYFLVTLQRDVLHRCWVSGRLVRKRNT